MTKQERNRRAVLRRAVRRALGMCDAHFPDTLHDCPATEYSLRRRSYECATMTKQVADLLCEEYGRTDPEDVELRTDLYRLWRTALLLQAGVCFLLDADVVADPIKKHVATC